MIVRWPINSWTVLMSTPAITQPAPERMAQPMPVEILDSASIDEKEEKPIGSRHNVKTASLYKRSILNPDIDREGQGRP